MSEQVIEKIRNEIRRNGFLSAVQIAVRFTKDTSDIDKLVSSIECTDIKRAEYANSFIGPNSVKDLFYYNPNKRKVRKKKTPANRKKRAAPTKGN